MEEASLLGAEQVISTDEERQLEQLDDVDAVADSVDGSLSDAR